MTVYFAPLRRRDLVKLYLEESESDRIQTLVRQADVVVTSVLAYPEARATFARRRRERLMTPVEAASARNQLDADWPRFVVIPFGDDLARAAGRLAETYGIRGGDAVHLASFEDLLTRCSDEDVRFSSADKRLGQVARATHVTTKRRATTRRALRYVARLGFGAAYSLPSRSEDGLIEGGGRLRDASHHRRRLAHRIAEDDRGARANRPRRRSGRGAGAGRARRRARAVAGVGRPRQPGRVAHGHGQAPGDRPLPAPASCSIASMKKLGHRARDQTGGDRPGSRGRARRRHRRRSAAAGVHRLSSGAVDRGARGADAAPARRPDDR